MKTSFSLISSLLFAAAALTGCASASDPPREVDVDPTTEVEVEVDVCAETDRADRCEAHVSPAGRADIVEIYNKDPVAHTIEYRVGN